jgi:hypothetical protein
MEFGLVIGFIEHLQIITTSNYSTVTNSHTLQFTAAHTKSSQSAVSSQVDVPLLLGSRSCRLLVISHQPPTLLTANSRIAPYIALAQKSPFPTAPPVLRVRQPLPSSGCFCASTVLALSKYATICFAICSHCCAS